MTTTTTQQQPQQPTTRSAKGHDRAKCSFTQVKCPTCGAQPCQNQHLWRDAKKCSCPERKALARRVAGILQAHFVIAERPCTGEAHKPEIGGMIDHCMLCAPRWAVVEYLTPAPCLVTVPEGTLPTAPNRSWAPQVIADSSGQWCGNALRFATKEEAEANVWALSMRWMLVRETRVVESTDEVNYRWDRDLGLVNVAKEG